MVETFARRHHFDRVGVVLTGIRRGAVTGNRTRILGVALRDSSVEPSPLGSDERRRDTGALPLSYGPVSGTGGTRTRDHPIQNGVVPSAFDQSGDRESHPDPRSGAPRFCC